jgi:localization factor PodJL
MTSGAPWSVKGIDPKAREVAKDLARRSGMTLGEWLNRMILEDDGPEEITSQAYFTERPTRPHVEAPRAPEPALRLYEAFERAPAMAAPPRYEAPEHPADEIGRVAMALDRLSGKIERTETRETRKSPEAQAADSVLREALARVEAAEREQSIVAARFEGAVEEARIERLRLAERLRKVEEDAAGPRSAEALRSLEAALSKVASHLYEGEGRTRASLEAMEERIEQVAADGGGVTADLIEEVVNRVDARLSDAEARTAEALVTLGDAFANLDGKVASTESGEAIEKRLGELSATLTQRVEALRGEIAQKLQSATTGRFDRVERQLGEMADTVRRVEQSSGQAIEKIGREVLTMADTLNRRVQATEHRSADAIEQVGGEVARIAQAMEARLGRSDTVHAEAMEKLGAEIGRITERLTERIGNSERRAAQAIDDVGEQVARVSERISQRQERASEDLAERIRLSEERTARLLEEAREKIDRSLAESQRRVTEQALAAAPALHHGRDEPLSPFDQDPFPDFGPAEPAADPLIRQALAVPETAEEEPVPFSAELESRLEAPFAGEPERPSFDAADFEAADGFAPIDETVQDEGDRTLIEEPEPEPDLDATLMDAPEPAPAEAPDEAPRSLSTREVIEQARAAARAAASSGDSKKAAKGFKAKPEKPAKTGGTSLFASFGSRPKKVAGSSLQSALLVAGGAAFLSLGAASYVVMDGEPGGAPPKRVADAMALFNGSGEIKAPEADTTPFADAPLAAVALSPQPLSTLAPPVAPVENAELASLYADAVHAIEAGRPEGLEDLRKAANLGHSPAQFYLAKLYEGGKAGLKADPAEARRWTERAAEGGNRHAMHNLGIAYIEGVGGPKNSATASQWFRRAADLGLVDSQYNLAALYERGLGVPKNGAEAYKWYLIAAKTGDDEARKSAVRVRANLTPEARSVAELGAQGFRPMPANASAAAASQLAVGSPVVAVATAQRALSRLGFYQGPMDGSSSPALKMAVAAYQRDQGMAPTGDLDQTTLSRLQVFTR